VKRCSGNIGWQCDCIHKNSSKLMGPDISNSQTNQRSVSSQLKQGRVQVTLRAPRYSNFQLFFGGQLISLIGTRMQTVALQSWLVYRMTARHCCWA
jgi:hypothetical protein